MLVIHTPLRLLDPGVENSLFLGNGKYDLKQIPKHIEVRKQVRNRLEITPIGFPQPKDEEDHPGLDFHSPEGWKQPRRVEQPVFVKHVFEKQTYTIV